MVLLVPVRGPAEHGWGRFFRVPSAAARCLRGAGRSAAPVPTLRPHVRQEAHWDTSCCGLIVSGPQHVAIEARTFVLIGSTFSRDPADAVEAGTRAGRTALRAHVRSRSLLLGVLGRGRERTSHSRARSLSARPMCPGIIAADLLSSPAKWHHRNRGSPLEGGSCPNRTQRTPTTFHRATRTAESCGSIRRTQYSLPPLYPIWTLPTAPRPSAHPERPDAHRHPSS